MSFSISTHLPTTTVSPLQTCSGTQSLSRSPEPQHLTNGDPHLTARLQLSQKGIRGILHRSTNQSYSPSQQVESERTRDQAGSDLGRPELRGSESVRYVRYVRFHDVAGQANDDPRERRTPITPSTPSHLTLKGNQTMPHHTHTLWPTLLEFGQWTARNCPACRWRTQANPNGPPHAPCDLPPKVCILHIRNKELPAEFEKIIFGPNSGPIYDYIGLAPYTCRSRLDKRGRPRRNPAF